MVRVTLALRDLVALDRRRRGKACDDPDILVDFLE
jgi:hypothetical protein